MRLSLFLLVLFFAPLALAADYAREKRWADEVTPGLLVGDAVYLQTSNGHKFLNLYTEAAKNSLQSPRKENPALRSASRSSRLRVSNRIYR